MVEDLKPILETPCGPSNMRPKATRLKFVYLDFYQIFVSAYSRSKTKWKKTVYVRVKPRRKKSQKYQNLDVQNLKAWCWWDEYYELSHACAVRTLINTVKASPLAKCTRLSPTSTTLRGSVVWVVLSPYSKENRKWVQDWSHLYCYCTSHYNTQMTQMKLALLLHIHSHPEIPLSDSISKYI